MAIPTYTVIADSEIDPESPLTSSLMFRLRDNILALLGIDPATPSPTMNIGESLNSRRTVLNLVNNAGAISFSGTEQLASTISGLSLEASEVLNPTLNLADTGFGTPRLEHMWIHDGSTGYAGCLRVHSIQVPYVLGVPQSVEITYTGISGVTATQGVFTSPNDNTTRTIVTAGSSSYIGVKTRTDATSVYIQFSASRGSLSGGTVGGYMNFRKTRYQSKNSASA